MTLIFPAASGKNKIIQKLLDISQEPLYNVAHKIIVDESEFVIRGRMHYYFSALLVLGTKNSDFKWRSEMKLDATKMKDWQIAEAAEDRMKSISQLAEEMGLKQDELIPMGRKLAKVDYIKACARLAGNPTAKYIDVTAITPTPLGEGKTTTAIGLVEGLGKLNKRVVGAIRQPSGGPTFNIKGSAAGGGLAQCIPLTPFSIRLTGDIDSITNAHNLCMVALTSRMQHEHNYDDARLAKSKLTRIDIDPKSVQMKWAMDFCAQSLRNIRIGQGGKMDGFEMDSGFQITVSSEVMAILAVARDLKDLRERIAKIVVAYDKKGNEVTTADLEVDGAMAAWMVNAINPNLLQTIEGARIRTRRPLRKHRYRPKLNHRRHDRDETGRLPCH